MTETKADGGTRSINIEHEIGVVPEIVWQTLTDPDEISRWFPLQAEVDPKVGGVHISAPIGPGFRKKKSVRPSEDRFGSPSKLVVLSSWSFLTSTKGSSTLPRVATYRSAAPEPPERRDQK